MPSQLFSPLPLRGVTLPNRIAVSPMCEYSAVDGFANDWHLVHLGSRAAGGAGMVIVEATAVEPRGRITYGDLGLWSDAQIEPLRRIVDFVKGQGSVPAIQIAHAGRKASCHLPWDGGAAIPPGAPNGWQVVAPSAVPFQTGDPVPHALTVGEIDGLVEAFAATARRAVAAGFEVIEIHGAHGYLISSFLSPRSNRREDDYGGSFENRARFLTRVIGAVRGAIPEAMPLLLRISAHEWVEGGWTPEDSVALARLVAPLGIDLIDCSSGGNSIDAKIPVAPGFQVPLAEKVRREAGVATGAVGLITEPRQAEEIVASGKADLVLLARELLRDPYFPLRAAQALGEPVRVPRQYLRAWPGSAAR